MSVRDWDEPQFVQAKPQVFGESDAQRGPYVGIVSYARPSRDKEVVHGLRCYLQPCFRHDSWFPVDSQYERETLEELLRIRSELPDGFTMDIYKPLFDELIGNPALPCRPDFVLRIRRNGKYLRHVAIETMGYGTVEYVDAKKVTHPRMKERYDRFLIKHDKMARSTAARMLADQRLEKQVIAAVVDGLRPE